MNTLLLFMVGILSSCSQPKDDSAPPPPPPPPMANEVDFWLTRGDQSVKLQKQSDVLAFRSVTNMFSSIEVKEDETYQAIDGFGYTLTGGSAQVINQLSAQVKQDLLQELFGNGANAIGISYLRISIGASDLNAAPFTYNDLPAGQTDPNLDQFSLAPDKTHVIPLLKQILAINPSIRIMATPWSPPTWMKDNNSFVGGSLLAQYYSVYAKYFVK